MTQEIEVWDDTAKPDSVETDPKPLSAAAEADSLVIAELLAAGSPATAEDAGTPFSRGEDVPPSDADFEPLVITDRMQGADCPHCEDEEVHTHVPVFDATTYLPVFDPAAPHVTHVSVAGKHHLQGGHLFSTGTKAHVASLKEIQ